MYLHNTVQNIKQYHLVINRLLPVLILKASNDKNLAEVVHTLLLIVKTEEDKIKLKYT